MKRLHFVTIVFCALATAAATFVVKGNSRIEHRNGKAPATVTTPAMQSSSEFDDRRVPQPASSSPAHENLPESDTTGLLPDSLTVDELLDEVNADHAAGFMAVDRERFTATVRSDPELRRSFGE